MNYMIVSEFTECTYEEFEDRMQFEILEKYEADIIIGAINNKENGL